MRTHFSQRFKGRMIIGARTVIQVGVTFFLTKQLLLRDWLEKSVS